MYIIRSAKNKLFLLFSFVTISSIILIILFGLNFKNITIKPSFIVIFILVLTIGLILINKIISSIIDPLEKVSLLLTSLSKGEIKKEQIVYNDNDEIGQIIKSTYILIDTIETTIEQANAVANGDFTKDIKLLSKSDKLGLAILEMTKKLKENFIKNKNEIWFSEGLGNFSNSLNKNANITTLAKQAITLACRYTNANCGVIYNYNETTQELSIIASFAYSEKNNSKTKFKLGEGIVGQVAFEKQSMLITNIQNNSYTIQSGTISIEPKEVFIIPLIHEDKLYGVMEIMSLEQFTELKKRYLQRAASIFVKTLHSTIQNTQIKTLLDESQKAYEELEIKSKEMKIQSEKLQASNRQLEEQQQQLQIQSANLQIKNIEIENAKKEIDKKAADLEISNKYKSEFLANMSHELRTPLNSVILLSSLLMKNSKNNLSKADIQKAKVINESGNELLRLINDILDLSKIESGKMELIIDEINTSDLAIHYEEVFSHTANDKGISFKVIDNIQDIFYNDKDRLGQVIRNLISNALKFTKDGGVTLKFEKNDNPNLPIKISVKDTGIGIPKDKQELIFQAFTQADGSTSRNFGGTGLGLSISKELTYLMQGDIKLESTPGEGSTFILLLPSLKKQYKSNNTSSLKENEDILSPQEKQPSTNNTIKQTTQQEDTTIQLNQKDYSKADITLLKNKKILIIDDDIKNIFILTSTLQEYEMDISYVQNRKEAINFLNETPNIDIILMDIMMPQMDGFETTSYIKGNELLKDIPIIAISAKAMKEDIQKALEYGATDYLTKPIDLNKLALAIATYLKR